MINTMIEIIINIGFVAMIATMALIAWVFFEQRRVFVFGIKNVMAWFLVQPEKTYTKSDTLDRSYAMLDGIRARLAGHEDRRIFVLWAWRASVPVSLVFAVCAFYLEQACVEGGVFKQACHPGTEQLLIILSCISGGSLFFGFLAQCLHKEQLNWIYIEEGSKQFGLKFSSDGRKLPFLEVCKRLKLVRNFNMQSVEYALRGALGGYELTIGQVHLRRNTVSIKKGEVGECVSSGVAIQITLRAPVPAFVYVCPENRFHRNSVVGSLPYDAQRCRLEDTRFEKAFEVFTNDQIAARTILTPLYLEKFMRLKELWPLATIHAALFDKTMLLTLETATLFPPQPFSTSLYDPMRLADMIERFDALTELVDAVTPYQRGAGLDEADLERPADPHDHEDNPLKWVS